MRGKHSESERGVRVPWRARLAEQSESTRFLPPCWLFVPLGGKNFSRCRPRGATRERTRENTRERGAAGARERRCAVPASMQEHELREGSVRRCGAEGPGLHWPSAAGADPAASSGVPPAMALECKPVRGNDTGVVGVSTGGVRLVERVAAAGRALTPEAARAHTVAACCACHTRCPWRGSGVHGRGGGVRAAAVQPRRVDERGLRGWVVKSRRSGRIISLARTAAGCGGTEVLNMGPQCRWGEFYRRIASSMFVGSGGKSDKHRTLCEG
eukprot:5012723-Pleurochrysis_carterae.AAC.1